MVDLLASAVIVAAGLYLALLGVSCFVRPDTAARFLLGFASSACLHYLELVLRVLVGAALIHASSTLPYPPLFNVFGWVLIVTSLVMFVVPWRWHRQFAQRAVPQALRYVKLIGASSIALGTALVWCVFRSSFA
ncbi:MAG: DUF2065 family protein [Dokdonella sp.]